MELTYGTRRDDEREADAELREQAFRVRRIPYDPNMPTADDDRVHVCRADGRLVGSAAVMPFGQWFGGRRVPLGGVAAVTVAPEVRGRSVARTLLRDALAAMRDRGEVLSGLFPTTARLYRSVGYEHGARHLVTGLSIDTLARVEAPQGGCEIAPLDPDRIVDTVAPVYEAMAAQHDGWLSRSELWWRRFAHRYADVDNRRAYTVTDGGEVVGAMLVEHIDPSGSRPGLHLYDLAVDGPFATTPAAFRAALAFLSGHGTTVGEVRSNLPTELLAVVVPDQHLSIRTHIVNMLRLVDMPGAVAARGYLVDDVDPIDLDVRDALAPWNEGRWQLAVDGGKGHLEPGGTGRVALDAATFAALWSGWASPWHLAAAGRLPDATAADLTALQRMFAARSTPHVLDFY
jgi:predicted acetyltransferase